jgi:phospholipid/cholesterol/gamma-HCH transport system substrate-binding protein
MLTRSVYVKLAIFVLITLVGISYVSANYVGITPNVFGGGDSCTIHADFKDSGGIFTNAEVTYRGVSIGRVGSLHLIKQGVRVDLKLDNCNNPKIPTTTAATVSDRSVIGEQYVNLIPPNNKGPYYHGGELIPIERNHIPTSAQVLLTNLDSFVTSVDTQQLASVIDELGKAFNGRGPDLATLLDSSRDLLASATQALPNTIDLINKSGGVLQTQLDESGNLISFARSLNLLSQQFKTSDPDIRHLLSTGPTDLQIVQNFVRDNKTDLGVVFADLASTGTVITRHIKGLEEILELYPALVAGGFSVINSADIAALSLVVNPGVPPDCGDPNKGSEGYEGTVIRPPNDLTPQAPNVAAHCTAPESSGVNVRGSANVPGGDPISATGGGIAYPRGVTASTVTVGTSLNNAGLLADNSWEAILTDSLH